MKVDDAPTTQIVGAAVTVEAVPSRRPSPPPADSHRLTSQVHRLAVRMARAQHELDEAIVAAIEGGASRGDVGRALVPPVSKQAVATHYRKIK